MLAVAIHTITIPEPLLLLLLLLPPSPLSPSVCILLGNVVTIAPPPPTAKRALVERVRDCDAEDHNWSSVSNGSWNHSTHNA